MVFEQFPENELIRINTNVFIQKSRYNGEYQLWFNVRNRYFKVGIPLDDEESARWHAKMLCSALEDFVVLKSDKVREELSKIMNEPGRRESAEKITKGLEAVALRVSQKINDKNVSLEEGYSAQQG